MKKDGHECCCCCKADSLYSNLVNLLASIVLGSIYGLVFFQYGLWMTFKVDVPWYVDALAGLPFISWSFRWWVVCVVLYHCGYTMPLFDSLWNSLIRR